MSSEIKEAQFMSSKALVNRILQYLTEETDFSMWDNQVKRDFSDELDKLIAIYNVENNGLWQKVCTQARREGIDEGFYAAREDYTTEMKCEDGEVMGRIKSWKYRTCNDYLKARERDGSR